MKSRSGVVISSEGCVASSVVLVVGSTAEGLVNDKERCASVTEEGKETDNVGGVELICVMAVLLPLQLFSDNRVGFPRRRDSNASSHMTSV